MGKLGDWCPVITKIGGDELDEIWWKKTVIGDRKINEIKVVVMV